MKTISRIAYSNDKKNKTRSILIMMSICLTTMLLVIISTVGNGMIRLQKSQAAGSYGSNYGLFVAADAVSFFSFLVKKVVVICKNLSKSVLYFNLLTSGKLYEHLAEIDTSARDMAEYLIKEMAKKQGVTEELKATDMMRWIGLMNNIRACADEIVLNDIVYS